MAAEVEAADAGERIPARGLGNVDRFGTRATGTK
jgi:hypothetical protein